MLADRPWIPSAAGYVNLIRFTVMGAVRTKKNHKEWVHRFDAKGRRRRYQVPSAAHNAWHRYALLQTNQAAAAAAGVCPIRVPVNLSVQIYGDHTLTGDAVGYYESIADLLQDAQVIVNDVQVVSWNGTWLWKDLKRPRLEIAVQDLPPEWKARVFYRPL